MAWKSVIITALQKWSGSISENRLRAESNQCFVCGPGNPIGLGVSFELVGDVCVAEFTPQDAHMGYPGVTHGGIVFSLLDDVMANWWFLQGVRCFTAKADIRYRAELPIGTRVRLEGRCEKQKGRLGVMSGRVLGADDGFVFAEATGHFMAANSGSHRGNPSST